jgi:hypothetical protein
MSTSPFKCWVVEVYCLKKQPPYLMWFNGLEEFGERSTGTVEAALLNLLWVDEVCGCTDL